MFGRLVRRFFPIRDVICIELERLTFEIAETAKELDANADEATGVGFAIRIINKRIRQLKEGAYVTKQHA